MTFEEWFAAQGFGLSSLWSAVPSSELKVKFKECWEQSCIEYRFINRSVPDFPGWAEYNFLKTREEETDA